MRVFITLIILYGVFAGCTPDSDGTSTETDTRSDTSTTPDTATSSAADASTDAASTDTTQPQDTNTTPDEDAAACPVLYGVGSPCFRADQLCERGLVCDRTTELCVVGPSCTSNDDCGHSERVCDNGACRYKECASDRECIAQCLPSNCNNRLCVDP